MKQPILHQLKTDGRPLDGMSYVIETPDDKTIVIDGGMFNDVEELYAYLKKLNDGKEPVVDLWIITHAHADHTFALIGMGERHAHEITVKQVMYRFPEPSFFEKVQPVVLPELVRMEAAIDRFVGVERIAPSAGERYEFGDLSMEILYTCADLPPLEGAPIPQCTNDTSLVFRFSYGGQTVLFLGDVQAAGNRVMIDRYGDYLKSDVMQLAHHGELSSTEEFYTYIRPEIVLWPVGMISVDRLTCDSNPANRFIFRKAGVKDFVIAGQGTRVMPMPVRVSDPPNVNFMLTEKTDLAPKIFIPYTDAAPSLTDFSDAAWGDLPFTSINGYRYGNDAIQSLEYRALWQENALYLSFRLVKNGEYLDDPTKISTLYCNLIRIYLTERLFTDYSTVWSEARGEGAFDDVKLFPNAKTLDGKTFMNTRGDLCESYGVVDQGLWQVNARIRFSKTKEKGSVIGLGMESCAVASPGAWRCCWITLAEEREAHIIPCSPAALLPVQLV